MTDILKCECTEHPRPCVPIPRQHARYQIRVGPDDQGVVRLCASCFVNGHMGMTEYRWRARVQQNEVNCATAT